MIWKTPISTAGVAPADQLELEIEGQPDPIVRTGASIHGWVYRSLEHPRCYRLVPLDQMPMQRKYALQEWVGRRFCGTEITKAWQPQAELPYYLVSYEVPGLQRTFAEALSDPDARDRLASAIAFLGALEEWWEQIGTPLLPTPADVALAEEGQAHPLPLPPWPLPDVEAFLAEPERLRYLAPEIARSQALPGPDNPQQGRMLDHFAVGVGVLGCFHSEPAPEPPEVAFLRAANGSLALDALGWSRLPAWATRIGSIQKAGLELEKWVSGNPGTREVLTPESLTKLLSECKVELEPTEVVRRMRDSGSSSEAFALAEKILYEEEDPELLNLAGELAVEIGRSLEALDYYERAIAGAPDPAEAAEAQFRVISSAGRGPGPVGDLYMLKGSAGTQLDEKLWRDFRLLTEDRKGKLELDMARHLLWRGRQLATSYVSAARFIAERLGVSAGDFRWWDLEMNLAYAEALLGQGALPQTRSQLATVKGALNKRRKSITDTEFRHWGERLSEMEAALVRREVDQSQGDSP